VIEEAADDVRRVLVGAAFTLALLASPSLVRGEARSADRIATTAGYTSGIRAVAGDVELGEARLEVWLHGDHATLRARYRVRPSAGGAQPWYAILAGRSEPSGPGPGHLQAGEFPTFLVGDGFHADSAAPFAPEAAAAEVPLPPFGFERRPRGRLHRWRHAWRNERWATAIWTVPYAGDTYGAAGPFDCSCGEPWELAIRQAYLALDVAPAGWKNASAAGVELVLHNRSGVAVALWSATGLDRLPVGETRRTTYGAGARPLVVSFLDGWRPGRPAHPDPSAGGDGFWPSRIRSRCGQLGREDAEGSFVPRRDRPWSLRCEHRREGATTATEVSVPAFLRSFVPPVYTWQDEPSPTALWFAAGLYRQQVNGAGAEGFDRWPWLEPGGREVRHRAGLLRRIDPARYRVTASSTLAAEAGRYAVANLGDGRPDSAWCEGVDGFGHGSELAIVFERPTPLAAVALLPGLVAADWLYEANAAPSAITILPDQGEPAWWGAPALASAELYKEGLWAPLAELEGRAVGNVRLQVTSARPGTRTGDMCASELLLFEPAPAR
jgi:hypothetical protein